MAKETKKAEIFMPPNTLRAKLGGSGYVDSDIVARAEKAMDGLKTEFSDWLADDIQTLNDAQAKFAAERNAETSGALFRAGHDLRGQATTFGFPLIARIASSLAKLMDGLAKAKVTLDEVPMPLVSAHIDAIQVIHRRNIRDVSNLTALTLTEELEGRVLQTLARAGA
jgi:chemotaxis protein histidine kinase CheA